MLWEQVAEHKSESETLRDTCEIFISAFGHTFLIGSYMGREKYAVLFLRYRLNN